MRWTVYDDVQVLPADWKEQELASVSRRRRGYSWGKGQETSAIESGTIPVIRIPNVTDSLDLSDPVHLRGVSKRDVAEFAVEKDWILYVASNGNPDRIGDSVFLRADQPMLFASFLQAISTKEHDILLPEFLARWMRLPRVHEIFSKTSQQTTGLANFSWSAVKHLSVRYPSSIGQQKAILQVLRVADDLILAAKNELLAATRLRTALLQQLFTRGLTNNVSKTRLAKMGTVPAHWVDYKMRDLIDGSVNNGYSPVCPQDPTGEWVLSLEAMTTLGFNAGGVKPAPVNDPKLRQALLVPDDLLLTRSNTPTLVGLAARFPGLNEPCYYPDLIMRFRVKKDLISTEYAEALLSSPHARKWFKARASGTSGSMVKIKRRDLLQMPLSIPGTDEQDEILRIYRGAVCVIERAREKLATFEQLRLSLLQNLLTGNLRIQEPITI